MGQATANMRESYYRKNITSKEIRRAATDRRSFIPMVVCRRQEIVPGAFLLLVRHRAGLKAGEQLPSGSFYPIDQPCFKSCFQNKITSSGLVNHLAYGTIDITITLKKWQCFALAGGSI